MAAQHIAAEIVGRYKQERPAYAAIALTTDTSALTAIGNDYGFDHVFARQVEGLGTPGDVLLAIDGQKMDSPDDMTRALENKNPGDRVALRVLRGGKSIEVRVTLDVAR